jgi:hypothetical protein
MSVRNRLSEHKEKSMNERQQKMIALGKEHFDKIILPKLKELSPEAVENMMVFIEGSVSYGFCDETSDIDIDYYIGGDVENAVKNQIRNVLNSGDYDYESVRISYGFGGDFWKFDLILENDMEKFWNEFNPYALYNIKHAVPVWDPKLLLPLIKKRADFFPPEMYKKMIRGLWITMNDSGEYNTLESLNRHNYIESKIYLYRAMEAVLRIVYVLNGNYYPPTKWLTTGLKEIKNDFELKVTLKKINESADQKECYNAYMKVYENIKQYMLTDEIIERESIENYGTTFQKPFYIFNTF